MIFRLQKPAPPLDRHIDFYWFYSDWDAGHEFEHMLPDGTFELVINLRASSRKLFDRQDRSKWTSFETGWISGTHSSFITIDTQQQGSMIGAHFRTGGAALFLPGPAREYRDQVVAFEQVWGKEVAFLREALEAAATVEAKFALLEHFLKKQHSRFARDPQRNARIQWAINELTSVNHRIAISQLSDTLGISHKHFICQFESQTGLTPKLFSRIRRFQSALAEIHRGRSLVWTDIADRCGYFDQAHFINDFRAFSGIDPTTYLRIEPEPGNFVPADNLR